MKKYIHASLTIAFICVISASLPAQEKSAKRFTILHTNDLQSRLLGFGPNPDYSPGKTGNDKTIGGFARLATLIKQRKAALEKTGQAVLVLDGGDITMGTLFHTVVRETGGELQLLGMAGYDAAAIGNHELDYGAIGLGQMIRAAMKGKTRLPRFLLANIHTSKTDKADDELEKLIQEQVVSPYVVIEKNGIRFGIFGMFGHDAWEVTAQQGSLISSDPIETARKMVKLLKEKEKVDVIILCSHGGVDQTADRIPLSSGEDFDVAKAVPEIDVIVGGHSHTPIRKPELVNGQTPILQAGSDARFLGELQMSLNGKRPKFTKYELHTIDDRIPGDIAITQKINELKKIVNARILKKYNLRFDTKIAEVSRDLPRNIMEPQLGNLVADAIRTQSGAQIGITSQGPIRDSIYKGQHGIQWLSDIFRIVPLGEGVYSTEPGYPLAMMYFTAKEIRGILEVLSFGYRSKGLSYFPQFSGIRFEYNSWRMPLDTVYKIELLNKDGKYEEIDFSSGNTKLYSLASNIYVARFLPLVEKMSKGMITVIPKDKDGKAITDMDNSIIDADPEKAGIQEIKEWLAIIKHIQGFPDTNANGIPDIPVTGSMAEMRMQNISGISNLFTHAKLTWIYIVFLNIPSLIGFWYWRKKRK